MIIVERTIPSNMLTNQDLEKLLKKGLLVVHELKRRKKCKKIIFFSPFIRDETELQKYLAELQIKEKDYILDIYRRKNDYKKILRFLTQFIPLSSLLLGVDIDRRREIIEKSGDIIRDFDKKKEIQLEIIKDCQQKEIERKNIVEQKAKANSLAITISITLFIAAISLLSSDNIFIVNDNFLPRVGIFLLGLGVFSFFCGGLMALESLRVERLYDVRLKDEAIFLNDKDGNDSDRRKELIRCIELNQVVTDKRAMYVSASYYGIRNGIVCLFLCFIIFLSIGFSTTTQTKRSSESKDNASVAKVATPRKDTNTILKSNSKVKKENKD